MNRFIKLEKMCRHFHLSLQSGCSKTLARMNRRYTAEEFEEVTNILRKSYDDVVLTTDIIVGFPGETDEEFEETYNFLEKIKFFKMHIFKYSPRAGTKAAVMKNQIQGNIKEQRSKKLIQLSNKNEIEYSKQYIGKTVTVLIEEKDGEYYKGHTANYIMVKTKANNNISGKIIDIKISDVDNFELIGEIVNYV